MDTPSTALALGLLAAGCADAHAQPRPDAGAPRRWILHQAARRGSDPFRSDGGVPAAFLRGAADDASDFRDVFAGAATTDGAPAPVRDEGAVGTLGRPASEGRFDDPERLAGTPTVTLIAPVPMARFGHAARPPAHPPPPRALPPRRATHGARRALPLHRALEAAGGRSAAGAVGVSLAHIREANAMP